MSPIDLMFNELCVEKETSVDLPQALDWLKDFAQVLRAFSRHYGANRLRTPIDFKSSHLIPGYSIGRFLSEEERLLPEIERNIIKDRADKGQYLEDIASVIDDLGIFERDSELHIFEFIQDTDHRPVRGLGAAFLLDFWSLSIKTEPCWDTNIIAVLHTRNSGTTPVEVKHASVVAHIGIPDRIYERNPKHDVETEQIAFMDLDDATAQDLLSTGIQLLGSERVYNYSRITGKIYIFPCHLTNCYHGYPIDPREITSLKAVLRQLLDRGLISTEEYKQLFRQR